VCLTTGKCYWRYEAALFIQGYGLFRQICIVWCGHHNHACSCDGANNLFWALLKMLHNECQWQQWCKDDVSFACDYKQLCDNITETNFSVIPFEFLLFPLLFSDFKLWATFNVIYSLSFWRNFFLPLYKSYILSSISVG